MDQTISEMEGDRLCASTNLSCIEMVCNRPTAPPSCCNRCTWQIIDKKKKKDIGNETIDEAKTTYIQHGFLAEKGSVQEKRENLKELKI